MNEKKTVKNPIDPEQEDAFLQRNKEIIQTLLDNCKDAIAKSDLNTFKQMIAEKKIFRCIMAAPGFTYDCAIKIELMPLNHQSPEVIKK